ncbi:histone-lysine N-methyltransferase SETD1B-like [Monodelphis domestica]|uniref:histone-lysine N-methyltransferase SETD1B-like n=1 Tax=Monodelphis domestica TaxID=13616 RepID=UPI000443561C|nr:histone-lysine N-methyltransferase SETD1B-like [Monodelphis domestica]
MKHQHEEDLPDLKANSQVSQNLEESINAVEDLVQPGPNEERQEEETEASSPSICSPHSSSSSSSYYTCVTSLSDSEESVSSSYYYVETITAEITAQEPDAKLEPIPKRSRLYSMEAWEGSILDSSHQNVSSSDLLIGKENALEGTSKEIQEEETDASSSSFYSPFSSSSSSSYYSFDYSLSDSEEEAPVSPSYHYVETITAEITEWEQDAKLEPI